MRAWIGWVLVHLSNTWPSYLRKPEKVYAQISSHAAILSHVCKHIVVRRDVNQSQIDSITTNIDCPERKILREFFL